MEVIYNEKDQQSWKRVWEVEKFDNISNSDERFFSILIKGLLSFLNRNVVLKGKPIPHYMLTSGSEYLYVENNDYVYSQTLTSGETTLYSKTPRCTIELGGVSIPKEELTSPYSRGYYERISNGQVMAYSSEMRRLPISVSVSLKYSLSDFNESIVLTEEILNNLIWQRYFNISFLGNIIECSIEFPEEFKIEYNKVDFDSTDNKNKVIQFDITLRSSYPQINLQTEIQADKVINGIEVNVNPHTYESGNFEKQQIDEDNSKRIYK